MKQNKASYNKNMVLIGGGILLAGTLLSALLFLALSLNNLNAATSLNAHNGQSATLTTEASLAVAPATSQYEALLEESISGSSAVSETSYTPLSVGQTLRLPQRGVGMAIYQGRTGLNKVALTFDSGWLYEPTSELLKALEEAGVRATFFLRGGWVEANPELVKQIKAGGHEIGNHTYTHESMPTLSAEEMKEELITTREAQRLLIGEPQDYYRPPYGDYTERDVAIAGETGYRFTVLWTVDSIDWTEPGQEEILDRIGRRLPDGGIALMHVGVWDTARVVPQIIAVLRERGLEPVPLSEILDWEIFPMEEYIVQEGDSVDSLALIWGVDPSAIVEINDLE